MNYKYLREGDTIEVFEERTISYRERSSTQVINLNPGDMIQYLGTQERFFGGREGSVYQFLHIPFEEGEPTGEDQMFFVPDVVKLLEGIGYEVS